MGYPMRARGTVLGCPSWAINDLVVSELPIFRGEQVSVLLDFMSIRHQSIYPLKVRIDILQASQRHPKPSTMS